MRDEAKETHIKHLKKNHYVYCFRQFKAEESSFYYSLISFYSSYVTREHTQIRHLSSVSIIEYDINTHFSSTIICHQRHSMRVALSR